MRDDMTAAGGDGLPMQEFDLGNGVLMRFAPIPAGTFLMGSPGTEYGHNSYGDETLHEVTLTRPYYLGVYEVTQAQYEAVMGENPTDPVNLGPAKPVDHVRRADAVTFCERLSARFGRTFRLPTGAEWEHACRAGTDTAYWHGDDASALPMYAWYDQGARISHDVGLLRPNPWGLFDMNGNLWEWIRDRYGDYPSAPQIDPAGPETGSDGDMRGGCAYNGDTFQRSASRHAIHTEYTDSAIGFRVLLETPRR